MELSVEGYKSIASKKTIRFDGLTILSGANSSGKSSFMQPFLILKQTVESHYDSGTLKLYGENARLTDSSQVISRVPDYQKSSFSIDMRSKKTSCRVTYRHKKGTGLQVDSSTLINQEYSNGFTIKVGMRPDDLDRSINKDHFDLLYNLFERRGEKAKWQVVRDKCFLNAEFSSATDALPIRAGIEPAADLEEFVTRLIHVPGLRGNPERTYRIAATDDIYPGSFEKYVASIISDWSRLKKNGHKYEALKNQIYDLGLASNVRTSRVDETSVEIQISRAKTSDEKDCVNIADVGFGVSQTLPVLVALLTAKKGQYVYIEQPELHLHPKAQFKLSSILVSAIKRGVKVIVETHSSVLIRGIQIAVVKGELNAESVSLNWFTQNFDTGETDVAKASLDKYGAFGDWPEDFDDTSLMVDQLYLDAVEEKACE